MLMTSRSKSISPNNGDNDTLNHNYNKFAITSTTNIGMSSISSTTSTTTTNPTTITTPTKISSLTHHKKTSSSYYYCRCCSTKSYAITTIVLLCYSIIFLCLITYYLRYHDVVIIQQTTSVTNNNMLPIQEDHKKRQKLQQQQLKQQQQQKQQHDDSSQKLKQHTTSTKSSTSSSTSSMASSMTSWTLIQEVEEKRQQRRTRRHHNNIHTSSSYYNKPTKILYGNERHLLHPEYEKTFNNNEQYNNIKPSLYSYAFLIGGIDPNTNVGYRGFLYNVLVATYILRNDYDSVEDVWIMIQLIDRRTNNNNTNDNDTNSNNLILELPIDDQILLYEAQIHIWYLPSLYIDPNSISQQPSFGETVYDKFRIVQMIEYRRIMFLDADIMPNNNLDYLFHLTDYEYYNNNNNNNNTKNKDDDGKLPVVQFKSNLIVATRGEPCNAGLFILQPYNNAYETILKIIDRQYQYIIDTTQSYPFFNRAAGWGHQFNIMNDYWTAIIAEGKRWDYHASHSDQGLLYYYTKYYLQDVSIVIGTTIENWISSNDTTILMKRDDLNETKTYGTGHTLPIKINEYNSDIHIYPYSDMISKPIYYSNTCVRYHDMINQPGYIYPTKMSPHKNEKKVYNFLCHVPYSNYEHFYGATKPWQQSIKKIQHWITTLEPIPKHDTTTNNTNTTVIANHNKRNIQYIDSYLLWFHTLRDIIWRNHNIMLEDNNNTNTNNVDNNNNNNETNLIKNEHFMNWWIIQADNISKSPLGYMAKWKEHMERLIHYHTRTNQSIPINFKNYNNQSSST